ncbi:HAD family hydrolase [Sphaerochaeta sp.]|uniref:HAD family hydrolase n=1 Tax=Sphaerochaeta sp. TaxID=1972642 RepID=UPI002FCA4343
MEDALLTTILLDLDGTLLPLDQKGFMQGYMTLFAERCSQLGYAPKRMLAALQAGLAAMLENDGSMTNKQRFDQVFAEISAVDNEYFNQQFASFYAEEFNQLRLHANPTAQASALVEELRAKGYTVVLATTPVFPWQGTWARLGWAGLTSEQFSLITTYEDCSFTKPKLGYYEEILSRLQVPARNCLMIGNDVTEDMAPAQLGMDVYLVTDCLINEGANSIDSYRKGSFEDLMRFCKELAVCPQPRRV